MNGLRIKASVNVDARSDAVGRGVLKCQNLLAKNWEGIFLLHQRLARERQMHFFVCRRRVAVNEEQPEGVEHLRVGASTTAAASSRPLGVLTRGFLPIVSSRSSYAI